jgi:hypothetical protein
MAQKHLKGIAVVGKAVTGINELQLRTRIIDEHYLRREISREAALRRDQPDLWRRLEASRKESNRAKSELNRKLRAAGCEPVQGELSLTQKMKKLQQVEARNRAETANVQRSKQ